MWVSTVKAAMVDARQCELRQGDEGAGGVLGFGRQKVQPTQHDGTGRNDCTYSRNYCCGVGSCERVPTDQDEHAPNLDCGAAHTS
jgi:hypothetical protein